ncbi:MAG: leucine-rich repeat protein [Victivallales bacterium]|nr:leucine-rich repeat protein [Victivallales bacterium]
MKKNYLTSFKLMGMLVACLAVSAFAAPQGIKVEQIYSNVDSQNNKDDDHPQTAPTFIKYVPASPTTNDDITVVYAEATDEDGDTITYRIEWASGSGDAYVGEKLLASETKKGDTWHAVITATTQPYGPAIIDVVTQAVCPTITIIGNTAPVLAADTESVFIPKGEATSATVNFTITDADEADTFTIDALGAKVSVEPNQGAVDGREFAVTITVLNAEEEFTDGSITVKVNDGTVDSNEVTIPVSYSSFWPPLVKTIMDEEVMDEVVTEDAAAAQAGTAAATTFEIGVSANDPNDEGEIGIKPIEWTVPEGWSYKVVDEYTGDERGRDVRIAVTTAGYDTIAGADRPESADFVIKATVTNAAGLSTEAIFNVTINDVDRVATAPTSLGLPETLQTGSTVSATPSGAEDADGDAIFYKVTLSVDGVALESDVAVADGEQYVSTATVKKGEVPNVKAVAVSKAPYATVDVDGGELAADLAAVANTAPELVALEIVTWEGAVEGYNQEPLVFNIEKAQSDLWSRIKRLLGDNAVRNVGRAFFQYALSYDDWYPTNQIRGEQVDAENTIAAYYDLDEAAGVDTVTITVDGTNIADYATLEYADGKLTVTRIANKSTVGLETLPSFVISVTDASGTSMETAIPVEITPVNTKPVVAAVNVAILPTDLDGTEKSVVFEMESMGACAYEDEKQKILAVNLVSCEWEGFFADEPTFEIAEDGKSFSVKFTMDEEVAIGSELEMVITIQDDGGMPFEDTSDEVTIKFIMQGMPLEDLVEAMAIVTGDGVTMYTSGTPWFLQTETYNSAPSAMQSGDIDDDESTSLIAKVTGCGTVTFSWKASSEWYDKLSFYIDGVFQKSISGNTEWTRVSFPVLGEGEHVLSWVYAKDESDSDYDDCAWVDDIVWESGIVRKDGILYAIDGDKATVIGIADASLAEVVIPFELSFEYGEGQQRGRNAITVVAIGEKAFENDNDLTSVVIPDSITSIASRAFGDCKNLAVVSLRGVEYFMPVYAEPIEIAEDAFEGCDSLKIVYTINSYVGEWFEENMPGVEVVMLGYYTLLDGIGYYMIPGGKLACTASEELYDSEITELAIPSKVDGFPVTAIASGGFWGVPIVKLTIPDSVVEIGSWGLEECASLEEIQLGSGVQIIGKEAFSGCQSLASVTIPNSVMTIGDGAFAFCSSMTEATIGSGVKSIGNYAFDECDNLRVVYTANNYVLAWFRNHLPDVELVRSRYYKTVDGIEYDYVFDGSLVVSGCENSFRRTVKNLVIPTEVDGLPVRKICESAFEECPLLESVTISEGVLEIEDYAFASCPKLTSVFLPASLDDLWEHAFRGADSLASIEVAEGNDVYASRDGVLYMASDEDDYYDGYYRDAIRGEAVISPFYYLVIYPKGKRDETFTLPSGTREIWGDELATNPYLKSIQVEEGNLIYVDDGNGVLYYAFDSHYDEDNEENVFCWMLFVYPAGKSDESFTLPAWVEVVQDDEYYEYSNLSSNTYLKSIQVEEGSEYFVAMDGVLYMANEDGEPDYLEVYPAGKRDEDFTIPATVTGVDASLAKNQYLKNILVEEESEDFVDNDGVLYRVLYAPVPPQDEPEYRGEDDLFYESQLAVYPAGRKDTVVTIPDGVHSIAPYAFAGCTETIVGFVNGKDLSEDYFPFGRVFGVDKNYSFCGGDYAEYPLTRLYFFQTDNEELISWFQYYRPEVQILGMEDELPDVRYVSDGVFTYFIQDGEATVMEVVDKAIVEAVIPAEIDGATVVAMDERLDFSELVSLERIVIPATLGNGYFYSPNLQAIEVAEGNPFYYSVDGVLYDEDKWLILYPPAKAGKVFAVPAGCAAIGGWAFEDAIYLQSVTIPDSVKKIQKGAFTYASSLVEMTIGAGVEFIGISYQSVSYYDPEMLDYVYIEDDTNPVYPFPESLATVYTDNEYVAGWFAEYMPNVVVKPMAEKPAPQDVIYESDGEEATITGLSEAGEDNDTLEIPGEVDGVPVTSIAEGAFEGSNLKEVIISSTITMMGERTFAGCTMLMYVRLSDRLETLADAVFARCLSLTFLLIPDSVTSIGGDTRGETEGVFAGCENLATIVIGNGVTSIADNAFDGCDALTTIYTNNESIKVRLRELLGHNVTILPVPTPFRVALQTEYSIGTRAVEPNDELIFGLESEAVTEVALPHDGPTYSLAFTDGETNLSTDIRTFAEQATWTISAKLPAGMKLTLDWEKSASGKDDIYSMPEEFLFTLAVDDAEPFDMRETTSVVLENTEDTAIKSFTLTVTVGRPNARSVTLEFFPGWNLIGIPFNLDAASIKSLQPFRPMGYDPVAQCYIYTDLNYAAGSALWVFTSTATSLTVYDSGEPVEAGITLRKGWNMVSPLYGEEGAAVPHPGLDQTWYWDQTGNKRLLPGKNAFPGVGYWIYSDIEQVIWNQ